MTNISKFFSNYWLYILLLLVVIFIVLLFTKVIKLEPETTTKQSLKTKER